MGRKNLIRASLLPYHVTARTNNKEWFDIPLSEVWEHVQSALKEAEKVHHVELVSFVLMSNHYHMLIITPESNLDSFMYEFNKRISLKIRMQSGRINKIFGARYKWCLIQSNNYFFNCYRYVYQNPVRAGIVERCEHYPYSTLRTILGNTHFSVPVHDKYGFKDEYGLLWLNKKLDEIEVSELKKKLARSTLVDLKTKSRKKLKVDDAAVWLQKV
ncbi:MAG: transposase [Methylotenera sp.]|nr:transposase [Flavobacterium sp.]